jgi:hypothetical protein
MTHGMPKAQADNALTLNDAWVSQLPAAPAHVLLLGAQPDAHAARLEALGYQVNSQPLNASQGLAQFPTPTRQPIGQVSLSLPGSVAASFAAALVLDFSPQIHPLALWDQLAHWLAEDAVVVLVGQVAPGAPPRMPKWLDYVVAIGARCGFTEQALSEGATAPGSDGFVHVFRKAAAPRWQVRHVRATDFDEIATLFQEVFGHPISRELWTWKYANGHGNGVVAARHSALIAHYGGMYRDVMLCGKPDWVFQICDVMVHPKERGVMTRQGPFLLTAATSAEIYGPLGFGFPNARAMEVAAKMGLYSEVGQMSEVRWEPSAPRFRLRTRLQPVVHGSAASQALVNSLWTDMARDLQSDAVGVRDWAFVEHRYFSHPHNEYEVLVVTSRLTGKPLGVMVLRRMEAMCELVDVITPLANLPLLIDQARRLTGLWGLPYLYCWITKNHLPRFLATEGQEVALNVSIPTSCWTYDPRANVFKDKWWLMSGDTDFR